MDKLVDKANQYFDAITHRIGDRMDKIEQNIDKDIEAGKKVVNKLLDGVDTYYDTVTDAVIEKTGLNKN